MIDLIFGLIAMYKYLQVDELPFGDHDLQILYVEYIKLRLANKICPSYFVQSKFFKDHMTILSAETSPLRYTLDYGSA